MNSHIRKDILNSHRAGESVESIAERLGFKPKQIETVIYPHGKDIRPLPIVVSRRIDPTKKVVVNEKKKRLADAGRKSWETRRRNSGLIPAKTEELSPPLDQPIVHEVEQLETMKKEEKEQILNLLLEGLEYMQVGIENFRKAIELLKK